MVKRPRQGSAPGERSSVSRASDCSSHTDIAKRCPGWLRTFLAGGADHVTNYQHQVVLLDSRSELMLTLMDASYIAH